MDWESTNLIDAWKKFKQHVELILNGPLKEKEELTKINYLLIWIGDKGRDVYNTWKLTEDEKKSLEAHFKKFKEHVQPTLNPVFARYKYNNEVQGTQTIEQFVIRLRLLIKDCLYANEDEMLRDRIVFGTNSHKVREKLINEGEKLDLKKAIQIAQSHEYAQQQLQTMGTSTTSSTSEVNAVDTRRKQQKERTSRPTGRTPNKRRDEGSHTDRRSQAAHGSHPNYRDTKPNKPNFKPKCSKCGYNHTKTEKCPAQGQTCNHCHKLNHFSKMCHFKKQSVHEVQEPTEYPYENACSNDMFDLYTDSIENVHNVNDVDENVHNINDVHVDYIENNQAYADVTIGSNQVRFKVDTGSQVNIIPLPVFKTLNTSNPLAKSHGLNGYTGFPLKSEGVGHVNVQFQGKGHNLDYHVIDPEGRHAPPILGLKSCLELGIVNLVDTVVMSPANSVDPSDTLSKASILCDYSDVFNGLGLFPGECTIHLDPDAVPVVHPPRRVPQSIAEKLKPELDKMEDMGVITKVTQPTPWVNSLVIVEKPSGDLRLCLDPRDLNKAILRPHYPLRTLEDVLPQLSGSKYFTKLDARTGYWTLKLAEDSSYLTTFNTPYGRYRFLRLPFGLKSSQDEFQRKIDESYEGLEGMVALVDDILVYGKSREEHDKNLKAVLERSRQKGIKLNSDKLVVGVSEVDYFGHLLTSEGLKPDPSKVSAIKDMQPPCNKAELETVLGMINYLAKFSPNLSEVTTPMRQLLCSKNEFVWDSEQDSAFQKVKDILTRTPGPILSYFDPDKEITLQVDASKFGLGATLLQDGKPVAFASKSLTKSEVNYAQIEKEMYAVLFGCKRFHQYVYGRDVIVQTDHKPLVPIMDKPIHAAPPRLQRMILQLQRYSIKLVFVPGKDIPVADTLSRKFLPDQDPDISRDLDAQVHLVTSNIEISDRTVQVIRDSTNTDPQCQALVDVIMKGWPNIRKSCPLPVQEYWNFRDELSFHDGLILKGHRLVIPSNLRSDIITKLHLGHMGVEKTLSRARDIVFWPKMSSQITDLILNCDICLDHRDSNAKEPLVPHEIPSYPWQVVGTDLFTLDDKDYVVVVDYFSRYFEVARLPSTLSSTVIRCLKEFFSRHGIPEKIISDNGPQYSSHEFQDFVNQWNITHCTSSPKYAQSNGLAEKTVQTVKRILKKSKASGQDPLLAFLEYRTTPLDIGLSPSQLLMSRRLRTVIPSAPETLKSQYHDPR